MDCGQIIKLHNRVFREAFGQVGGQPRGLCGIARQTQCEGRYSFNISAGRESQRGLRLLLCQAHVAHQRLSQRSFGLVVPPPFLFRLHVGPIRTRAASIPVLWKTARHKRQCRIPSRA